MKKCKILVLVGIFALISGIKAQDYAFKVMANKGSNEVKSGSVWQALKTGDKLNKQDELKVAENSYVALVHSSGKPIELKESKTYSIADLAAKVSPGASVVSKYTDFILSSNSAEAKKNRLSATGSVVRALDGDINVLLPPSQFGDTFNPLVYIKWETKVAGPYEVVAKNMFGDELMKIETPENAIQINRNDPKFMNEDILIEVRSKGDKKKTDKSYLLRRLSSERQNLIKKLIAEMGEDIQQETALNKFIMAGFYEENKLFVDAIGAYEEAIKLAPDVPTYKEAYEEYLLRNKLKKPVEPSK
jgi:tetratricopeptide (TPR) repeat protein